MKTYSTILICCLWGTMAPLLDAAAVTTHGDRNPAVRTADWRYIRYANGGEELDNHRKDPYEWENLAEKPDALETIKDLAQHLPKKNRPKKKSASSRNKGWNNTLLPMPATVEMSGGVREIGSDVSFSCEPASRPQVDFLAGDTHASTATIDPCRPNQYYLLNVKNHHPGAKYELSVALSPTQGGADGAAMLVPPPAAYSSDGGPEKNSNRSRTRAKRVQLSGIYPHLAMFNNEGECGTGAVVPWAGRLWVVTYAPHRPEGDNSNMLYEITPDLRQIIRPESIGGTPANRMIHGESKQLFIGPYAIGADRTVRVIPYTELFGRPTGTARHLADPAGKVVTATMEEGIYEIDARSLDVAELWGDEAKKDSTRKANLPGYHGKGFYSGQGVYVYANNGEHGEAAMEHPDIPSGALAEWDGKADAWTIVRRNQFTEVTGPGGIHGNPHPATDPIWTVGWDFKSLLLGVRMPPEREESKGTESRGAWTFYRLPKGSHSYDGAHGWNTEWPRIREIGEKGKREFLMTMHGTFWHFPANFTLQHSAGIAPRSNYLKVVGDFCRWNNQLVLGCDDSAKMEFLNTRRAKGKIAGPQSQSNLWFLDPARLDHLGPTIGRGAVWVDEPVKAGVPSDPYLFSGYDLRGLHLHSGCGIPPQSSGENTPTTIHLEIDRDGTGTWSPLKTVEIPAEGYCFVAFTPEEQGAWIRLTSAGDIPHATAAFTYRKRDARPNHAAPLFDGLAKPGDNEFTGGIVRARGGNKRTLSFASVAANGSDLGYYELDADLKLRRTADPAAHEFTKKNASIAADVLSIDDASVIYTDDSGKRWRLPMGEPVLGRHPLGDYRVAREVATERDLFNAHGTFYELPARNAGGFAKIRPVATHNRLVHDFCSYRGLFIISGIAVDAPEENRNIVRSDDGKTALWAGAIDDVWQLGKPRGTGGPWKETSVRADIPSDPYLMTAYDKKSLTLSADKPVAITAEIDLTGEGRWAPYSTFKVNPGTATTHTFPDAFSAYWIRFRSDKACTATAILDYK